jgi:hypothetical protein
MINPPDPKLESIDGDTYQLAEAYPVEFGLWLCDLEFSIPAGTITDLASIPWYLRWIIDRASLGILPALVHDFLCDRRGKVQTLYGETIQVSWFDANVLFLILMRIDGVNHWRAFWAFVGVTIGSPRW